MELGGGGEARARRGCGGQTQPRLRAWLAHLSETPSALNPPTSPHWAPKPLSAALSPPLPARIDRPGLVSSSAAVEAGVWSTKRLLWWFAIVSNGFLYCVSSPVFT